MHGGVYFRISLKRGQMPSDKIQGIGANTNPRGSPILKVGKANCYAVGEGDKSTPYPPEMNPAW